MIPEIGQHVKCLLRNNSLVEGIVKYWNTDRIELQSLDEKSILIIPHPEQDIMMIKILLENISDKENSQKLNPPNHAFYSAELEKQIQETYDLPSDDPRRIKTIAELKIMLAEQEKKIIVEKMKEHHLGDVRKVQYGYPGLNKKPRTQ